MTLPLPPLPANAPGINGFKYRPQFGVLIVCKDEAEHKALYEHLHAQGFQCKAVRV